MNTKAQGLSMSILVVAALAVMVLLLVGVFFTGGFRAVGANMIDFVRGSTGGSAGAADEAICTSWCTKQLTMDPGDYYPRPSGTTAAGGSYCSTLAGDSCGADDLDCDDYC